MRALNRPELSILHETVYQAFGLPCSLDVIPRIRNFRNVHIDIVQPLHSFQDWPYTQVGTRRDPTQGSVVASGFLSFVYSRRPINPATYDLVRFTVFMSALVDPRQPFQWYSDLYCRRGGSDIWCGTFCGPSSSMRFLVTSELMSISRRHRR